MTKILLILTLFLNLYATFKLINLKYRSKIANVLMIFNILMLVSTTNALFQVSLPPILINSVGMYFENFSAIGMIFFAPLLFTLGMLFLNPDFSLKRIAYIYILPIVSLITLWSNDSHRLFFENYSIYYSDIIYGKMYLITLFYSIVLYIFTVIIFSYLGYFSQSKYQKISKLFLSFNALCVLYVFLNLISVFKGSRLLNPVIVSNFGFVFTFGLMQLNLINIFPIANDQITDIMTDPFLLLNPNGIILETNPAFKKFITKNTDKYEIDTNLFKTLKKNNMAFYKIAVTLIKKAYKTKKIQTKEIMLNINNKNVYFDINAQTILDKNGNCISILFIFKNITKQKNDLLTIEHDHELLTIQQQMSIVGELASGFAHDLNTPITAIKTGISILKCNQNLTEKDKEKIFKMEEQANKIINFSTNIRSQIREIGNDKKVIFSVNELIKNLIVILEPEYKAKKCTIVLDEKNTCFVYGNLSKLSQVILNIISNAIDAFDKPNGEIIITVKREDKTNYIEIKDNAGGIDESISKLIFKKVLTSKSKAKTGMGLYISNSIIKSLFNGDISFTTAKNIGTSFVISLPVPKEIIKEESK